MLHHINKLFIKHFLNTYLLGVVFNNGTKAMVVKLGGQSAPREHLTMSENSFGCHSWERSATGI